MIDPAIFICAPAQFQNVCKIYPPTVADVIGNPNFPSYLKLLTISQEELEESSKGNEKPLTPLEFLLSCSYYSLEFREKAIDAFQLFTKKEVTFLFDEKALVVGDLKEGVLRAKNLKDLPILDEKNYFEFQNMIRKSMGQPMQKEPPPFDPTEDPRVRKMKQKMRERDRLKAKQAQEGKKQGGISMSTTLVAICCMGIGITPLNIGELSYASIEPIMNMMQEKEKYDIDIRSLLAGADSKKIKPKYWIRNAD